MADYTRGSIKNPSNKKKWWKIGGIVLAVFLLVGGVFAWKTGRLLNKISTNANLFGSLGHMVPGVNNQIKGEKEGRINVLLLAMRGADDPSGGTLADSSMIISLDPKNNKVSYISIPRDLLVQDVQNDGQSKINAVYAQGFSAGGTQQGIKDSEQKYSEVAGVPIDYTIVGNYQAFTDLVNAVGGVPLNLDKPFEENAQFSQLGVCDGVTFTKPSGQYQNKIVSKHHVTLPSGVSHEVVVKKPLYPLCYNEHPECNGDFKLPAGQQTLDATTALCFARSRDNSSDFDRAKRQQMILQSLEKQAFSIGTLTNYSKVTAMFDSIGNNVSTDMQGWEMNRLYDIYMAVKKTNPVPVQRVIDEDSVNSANSLVYGKSDPTYGDVLLPVGDNYDKIHEMVQNTFTDPPQDDISVIQ